MAPERQTLFNCINDDLDIDGGHFFLMNDDGSQQTLTSDDIGYVLSTPVVPEFLTGREFIHFFIDINRKQIKNPKTADEYMDLVK